MSENISRTFQRGIKLCWKNLFSALSPHQSTRFSEKVRDILDLKGVPCPMNFVKTKLRLEQLNAGEVLEVILDDGDPIKNVTGSVKEEGHKILKVEKINEHWKLIIKKEG